MKQYYTTNALLQKIGRLVVISTTLLSSNHSIYAQQDQYDCSFPTALDVSGNKDGSFLFRHIARRTFVYRYAFRATIDTRNRARTYHYLIKLIYLSI